MTAATVLIPTHNHGETLRYSLPTALQQTVDDIEVFIIGDAVPDVSRAIAREFAARDPRVRFFDFPKGPSRGEIYRHQVLQEARGEIVCYLFDDDLWLPDHIEVMRDLLREADFAFTMPAIVGVDGSVSAPFVDLARPLHRRLFTNSKSGMVSEPTSTAHTMALYRRLPHGWRTTPPGFAPDKYMWAQCLGDPRTIARSGARPTAILFPDPPRREWPQQRRLDELRDWSARLDDARAVRPQRFPDVVLRGYELSLRVPFGRALSRVVKRAFDRRSAPAGG
jgi:glycosyltransferase involved in cell wall biosynthesis